jgi:glucosamine--fructose-6-phosphate aminotransferase (isomerizing)
MKESFIMCGIVGYIGNKNISSVLLNGLKKLEYRGYDSAGIAILKNKRICVVKTKGRLAVLEEKLKNEKLNGFAGIGHTRWATHGEPNDVNSHPHISNNGKIAVVHNGIIENYIKLKDFLTGKGFEFRSETDTEVIAHLIEYNYKGDILKAVMNTMNDVEGAYALGVVCTDYPDRFVAARKDSPLIVGIGNNENFIASDIPAILEYTRDIYILEDKEIVSITADGAEIYNLLGEKVDREIFHVDWDVSSAEKGGYEHFMMKEICDEPSVIKATINPRIQNNKIVFEKLNISDELIKNCEKINIIACGTAYHAGVIGKYAIEKLARIPVEVEVASEFRYRDPMVNNKQLTIVISQSGETLDTCITQKNSCHE